MLTQTVEYALRIAICLAKSDPRPRTADEIARETHVPRAYLAKVIQAMVRGGTAHSKRGVGGGVCLKKPANDLTLLDVINSVAPLRAADASTSAETAMAGDNAGLDQRFEMAIVAVEDIFNQATLAEMAAEGPDAHEPSRPRESPEAHLRRTIANPTTIADPPVSPASQGRFGEDVVQPSSTFSTAPHH